MEKMVNIDKQQLLDLLRQYRQLITEHLNLTNETIKFSEQIQQLLIALEKYEDDFAAKLPNEDMKFRDSLRQLHKMLKVYFAPKKAKLAKHFHSLTQQVQNSMAYVRILDHHVAKASRNLQMIDEVNKEHELIKKNLLKLARAEQAARGGYKCIKLEIREAHQMIVELRNEISSPAETKKNELVEEETGELALQKEAKNKLFEHIIKHSPAMLSTVEKAEIQDHLINYLERLELRREEAYFNEEEQHDLMHIVNENQRKSKALQSQLNAWLKKQRELELQMQKVYALDLEQRAHKHKVFSLSMEPQKPFEIF